MDSKDFNQIGVGVDDLIEAYMQVWPTHMQLAIGLE
jgi:hypothetical protein